MRLNPSEYRVSTWSGHLRSGGRGNFSERPIFIVGMPRSGTTLTEQILASHPNVHAAEERLFWGKILGGLVKSAPPHA